MSWIDSARARLPENLDENGDLPPPWARFPTFERYSIGWRMGTGEDWLGLWRVFLDGLPRDASVRRAYLKRHPAAPINWADSVYRVLEPDWDDEDDEDEGDEDAADRAAALRREVLLADGFIASDVAYTTWLASQADVRWPWQDSKTPRDAARWWTRDLWFWSRRVAAARADGRLSVPDLPWPWRGCREPLQTGEPGRIDKKRGLLTLARMLCAGRVVPPWAIGCRITDFADTFDDDMGYVDAYRLWGMSAFDDAEQVMRLCSDPKPPAPWAEWLDEQFGSF